MDKAPLVLVEASSSIWLEPMYKHDMQSRPLSMYPMAVNIVKIYLAAPIYQCIYGHMYITHCYTNCFISHCASWEEFSYIFHECGVCIFLQG